MALFGPSKKVRRPVAEIVSGLSGMLTELDESNGMAADEQQAAEEQIMALNATRKLLINEQAQAGTVASNLRSLLGMDLDGDGEADDLDRAIAAMAEAPAEAPAEVEVADDE